MVKSRKRVNKGSYEKEIKGLLVEGKKILANINKTIEIFLKEAQKK